MTKKLGFLVLLVLAALLMTGGAMSAAAEGHDFSADFYGPEGVYTSSITHDFTLERDCRVTFSLTNISDLGHSVNYTARISYISGAPATSSYNYNFAYCGDTITVVMDLAAGRHTVQVSNSSGRVGYTLSMYGDYPAELDKTDIYPAVGETIPISIAYQHDLTAVWTSDAPKTASVTSAGVVKGLKAGSTVVRCALSDGTQLECAVHVVTFAPSKVTIHIGDTVDLTRNDKGALYGWTDIGASLKWKSSDRKTASVTSAGVVKGLKAGSVKISVTIGGKKTLTKTVRVTPVPTLSESRRYMLKGSSLTLKINDQDGLKAKWTSDDTSVATVTSKGVVKAKGTGKTTIRCTLSDGTALSCWVGVFTPGAEKLTLDTGETYDLYYHNGYQSYVWDEEDDSVKWSSSDKKVVSVDQYGEIKALKAGTAKISVTLMGKQTFVMSTVRVRPILDQTEMVLVKGEKGTLKIKGAGDAKVTWQSSDTGVATVKDGVVTAVKNGNATISAKVGEDTLKCAVSVKPVLTIEVLKITDTSIYNEVYVTFHNNSNKKIVYTKLNIYQYNNAGKRLTGPNSYYYHNETIPAKGEISYWEYWVHNDTKKVKIEITEVTFADGTKWRP